MSQFAALVVELAAKLGQAVPSAKVPSHGGFWLSKVPLSSGGYHHLRQVVPGT